MDEMREAGIVIIFLLDVEMYWLGNESSRIWGNKNGAYLTMGEIHIRLIDFIKHQPNPTCCTNWPTRLPN